MYRGSGDGDRMRYTVHGVAYIDEHLMMMVDKAGTSNDRPYYYVQDRLYNVWAMIDRAGAIVERYAYDAYGLPLIRESAGRGDMDNDTLIDADGGTDKTRMLDARDGVIWDPRADMDDDGDVDDDDVLLWSDADNVWPESEPTVAQAHSDVDNPFMFQGVRHFALDTPNATSANLPLNQHRLRFMEPWSGRWTTRDPIGYADSFNLYEFLSSNPNFWSDPWGDDTITIYVNRQTASDDDVTSGRAGTGHAWIDIEDDEGRRIGGGLYPEDADEVRRRGRSGGTIRDDTKGERKYDEHRSFEVTPEQAHRARRRLIELEKEAADNKLTFRLSYNCVDFVCDIANTGGLRIYRSYLQVDLERYDSNFAGIKASHPDNLADYLERYDWILLYIDGQLRRIKDYMNRRPTQCPS